MGPIHNNFISWRKPNLLIIGQPDKILTDITNSKQSSELSATLMETLVSGEMQNVSNLGFSLFMSDYLAEVRDTAKLLLHFSRSPHFFYRQP